MNFSWTVTPTSKPPTDLLATALFNHKPYVAAVHCQTCGEVNTPQTCLFGAFCSDECYKSAWNHCRGNAVIPMVYHHGKACVVLCIDPSKYKGSKTSAEIPGGRIQTKKEVRPSTWSNGGDFARLRIKDPSPPESPPPPCFRKQDFPLETPAEGAARECQEEMGLYHKISGDYLKGNSPRFLLWYPSTRGRQPPYWVNYQIFFMKLHNFDIGEACRACRTRYDDKDLKSDWKETQTMFAIPFESFRDYGTEAVPALLDCRGREVRNLSARWKGLLTDPRILDAMSHYIKAQDKPWLTRQARASRDDSFVWDHRDLPNETGDW